MGKNAIVIHANDLTDSSINRDRNGSIKMTVNSEGKPVPYISSQCRRQAFRANKMDEPDNRQGIKMDVNMAIDCIINSFNLIGGSYTNEQFELAKNSILSTYGLITDVKNGKKNEKKLVDNLGVFYNAREIEFIVKALSADNYAVLNNPNEIDNVILQAAKNVPMSRDVALFGRMIASKPNLNVNAALSCSDLISIFSRKSTPDFYTSTVDDKNRKSAINLGNIDMVSMIGYSAFTIDVDQLKSNLNDTDEVKAVLSWEYLKDFVEIVGNGRQHSKFCQTRPLYVAMIVTDGNAFNIPDSIISRDGNVKNALQSIHDYLTELVNDPNNASDHMNMVEFSPSNMLGLKCNFNEFIKKNIFSE